MIGEGKRLRYHGEENRAVRKVYRALEYLDRIEEKFPSWNPDAVKTKIASCEDLIRERLPDQSGREAKGLEGEKLVAHFIDVGQGDSTLIRCPGGENILIDGGKWQAAPKVLRYLRQRGIEKIDLMIATHPDPAHTGGLTEVIRHFEVKKFVDPGRELSSPFYVELLQALTDRKIPRARVRRGDQFRFGGVTLKILNPPDQLFDKVDDCSIVAEVRYGGTRFLLSGDAEQKAEIDLFVNRHLSRCQVLKVGQHGSSSSNCKGLLRQVKPEVAVVSCGKDNIYGHPTREVLDRLTAVGCEIRRTDRLGDIRVESDGRHYVVISRKEKRGRDFSGKIGKSAPKNQISTMVASAPPKPVDPDDDRIEINGADLYQLDSLPGIGPVRAQSIIDYRRKHGPFTRVQDLAKVYGIGPKTVEKLKDKVRFDVSIQTR